MGPSKLWKRFAIEPAGRRRTLVLRIDQYAGFTQPFDRLAMPGQPRVESRVIDIRRRGHKFQPCDAQSLYGFVDVVTCASDMLDALATIGVQELFNLAVFVGALVDRDADLAQALVIARECSPVKRPCMSK